MLRPGPAIAAAATVACALAPVATARATPAAAENPPRADIPIDPCQKVRPGFHVLRSFGNSPDGWQPWGSPTMVGSTLWGRTTFGDGNGSAGVIWSMDPLHSSSSYRIKHRFGGTVAYASGGSGPDVSNPHHDWMRLSPNGKDLLGAGKWGGRSGVGGLFLFDTTNAGYRLLHSFNGVSKANPKGSTHDGANPHSNPQPARDLVSGRSLLVGMTAFGGTSGVGAVYRLWPDGSHFSLLHSFDGPNGSTPHGFVIQSGNYLYGMTGFGGITPPQSNFPNKAAWAPFSQGNGVVFRLNMRTGRYQVLHKFGYRGPTAPGTLPGGVIDGAAPDHGGLVVHNGRLYGLTTYGARNGGGAMFSIRPDGTQYRLIRAFGPPSAGGQLSQPHGTLVTGPGNWLYALMASGGANNAGGVFRYNAASTTYQQLHAFNGAAGGAVGEDDPAVVVNCGGRVTLQGMTKDGGAVRSTLLPTPLAPDWTASQPAYANGIVWQLVLPHG